MSKQIVAAASLSKSEFDSFLAGSKANASSKARYVREWKANHVQNKTRIQVGNETKKPGVGKPKVKETVLTTKKEVVTKKTRFPIGEKRLNVDYKQAKIDFAKYSGPTQARYWSAWQKYRVDHSEHKDVPNYRIILSYRAKIDGHVMKDSDGKDVLFHWSLVTTKKRLSKKELELYAEEIRASTNVQVFGVKHVIAYDNWTGKQV